VSKGGSSTTEARKDIPAWLETALKPLLRGSAENLSLFARQGQNVLQGNPYNAGIAPPAPGGGGDIMNDPRVQAILAGGGGRGVARGGRNARGG
jgi:hypothetical protein